MQFMCGEGVGGRKKFTGLAIRRCYGEENTEKTHKG